jgi:hypothetical protein
MGAFTGVKDDPASQTKDLRCESRRFCKLGIRLSDESGASERSWLRSQDYRRRGRIARRRPSERTKDSATIRWAGWSDQKHLRDTFGFRTKTVGEDEGIGVGLVCTQLD